METFELDPALFTRANAGDDKLLVIFHWDIMKDENKSVSEGRPIFTDVEFVRIFVPGDKTNVIDRPARDTDKQRFPKQYAAFKAGESEDAQIRGTGTMLSDWPMVGRSQVAELHYFGIRTVEQLAEVSDSVCLKVAGLTSLKQTAGVWLQKSKSTAEAAKIASALDELRQENKGLAKQCADAVAMNAALQDQLRELIARGIGVPQAEAAT